MVRISKLLKEYRKQLLVSFLLVVCVCGYLYLSQTAGIIIKIRTADQTSFPNHDGGTQRASDADQQVSTNDASSINDEKNANKEEENQTIRKTASQPHILLVITDDQGYNDVGYNEFTKVKTPYIDELARNGIILDNYYVQSTCTPTRGQLFTGRHEIHTGLDQVILPGIGCSLPLNMPTIADKLQDAGYSTNLVGKWHLGFQTTDHLPTRRGFDHFFGLLNGHSDYFSYYTGSEYNEGGYDLYEDEEPADVNKYKGIYSTKVFADRAIDIVNSHHTSQPLFLVVAFTAPHTPFEAPKEYIKPYEGAYVNTTDKTYAGMITCLDEAVGNITQAFKAKGLWENTVMIYTSDNGAMPLLTKSNYPLRGHKGTILEGGIKVPAFVYSDLMNTGVRGTVSKELMHVTDWFPTLIRIGQGDIENTGNLYGLDLSRTILKGERSPRTEILHELSSRMISPGNKIFNDTFDTRIRASLRMGNWKILTGYVQVGHYYKSKHDTDLQLYNIKNDPTEAFDMSKARPDIVKQMLDRLEYHRNTMVPHLGYIKDERSFPKYHDGFWRPWM
ncbi:hypothetical protein ACF0H5_020951 [Mactra antiquata]